MSDRASRDLFLAQRFARHVSPLTTTVYTHPSDERDVSEGAGAELLIVRAKIKLSHQCSTAALSVLRPLRTINRFQIAILRHPDRNTEHFLASVSEHRRGAGEPL